MVDSFRLGLLLLLCSLSVCVYGVGRNVVRWLGVCGGLACLHMHMHADSMHRRPVACGRIFQRRGVVSFVPLRTG